MARPQRSKKPTPLPAWISTFPGDDEHASLKKKWLLEAANCRFGKTPIENTKPYGNIFEKITGIQYYKLIRIADPFLASVMEVDQKIEWRRSSDLLDKLSRDITEKLVSEEMNNVAWAEESRNWIKRFLFASFRVMIRRHRVNKKNHERGYNLPYDVWRTAQQENPRVSAYASALSELEDDGQPKDCVPEDTDKTIGNRDIVGLPDSESGSEYLPQSSPQRRRALVRDSMAHSVSDTRSSTVEQNQRELQAVEDGKERTENQSVIEMASRKRKRAVEEPIEEPYSARGVVSLDREQGTIHHDKAIQVPALAHIYEIHNVIEPEPHDKSNRNNNPSTANILERRSSKSSPVLAKLIADSEQRHEEICGQELKVASLELDRLKLEVTKLEQEEQDSRELPKTVATIQVLLQEKKSRRDEIGAYETCGYER
ncbi:hypothetical protein HYFRA_00007648 [Hymenoscyphus fraxineus]|uniref:Uncharacterized protein n=1 Tax=Hymenoscyphus fraxineus TaxID=746836 RepID=A0A9N9KUL1_9HELO|nr:hypothetical protein HYFRA_00007648 [Hymenoscyphus fraxineus]